MGVQDLPDRGTRELRLVLDDHSYLEVMVRRERLRCLPQQARGSAGSVPQESLEAEGAGPQSPDRAHLELLLVQDVEGGQRVDDLHRLEADRDDPGEQVDDVARVPDLAGPVVGVVDDARGLVGLHLVAVDDPLDRRARAEHVAVGLLGDAGQRDPRVVDDPRPVGDQLLRLGSRTLANAIFCIPKKCAVVVAGWRWSSRLRAGTASPTRSPGAARPARGRPRRTPRVPTSGIRGSIFFRSAA